MSKCHIVGNLMDWLNYFCNIPDGPEMNMMDSVFNNIDLNASTTSIGSPALLGSFPVDVVVFIRVEPSIIR